MTSIIYLFLPLQIAISQPPNIEQDIKHCMESHWQPDFKHTGAQFFEMVSFFENYLVYTGHLQDKSKESYRHLMKALVHGTDTIDNAELQLIRGYDEFSSPGKFASLPQCFESVLHAHNYDDKSSANIATAFNNLKAAGDYGIEAINLRFINSVSNQDWEKLVYRIPALAVFTQLIHSQNIRKYKWKRETN